MRLSTLVFLCLVSVLPGRLAQAFTLADFQFDDPRKEQEFRQLTEQLRCLVCQNESLAGSNAELAQDLRREIYAMMKAGKSRDDVIDFMVARYGDFVLYNPPLKPSTYPLWLAPFVLLLIGVIMLFRTLARKKSEAETELSAKERQRVQDLLRSESGQPPTDGEQKQSESSEKSTDGERKS